MFFAVPFEYMVIVKTKNISSNNKQKTSPQNSNQNSKESRSYAFRISGLNAVNLTGKRLVKIVSFGNFSNVLLLRSILWWWEIFPDAACHRQILDLTVKCCHSGCSWTGELRAVEVCSCRECIGICKFTDPFLLSPNPSIRQYFLFKSETTITSEKVNVNAIVTSDFVQIVKRVPYTSSENSFTSKWLAFSLTTKNAKHLHVYRKKQAITFHVKMLQLNPIRQEKQR